MLLPVFNLPAVCLFAVPQASTLHLLFFSADGGLFNGWLQNKRMH
jgi:hypothetical protein